MIIKNHFQIQEETVIFNKMGLYQLVGLPIENC